MARQGQEKGDDTMVYLFLGIGAVVAIFFLWSHFSEQINTAYAKLKIYETWAYSFWSDDWQHLTRDIQAGRRDLAAAKFTQIGKFYNRYAAFAWLPVFAFMFWRVMRKPTLDSLKTMVNRSALPEDLLATTTRFFSPAAPWVRNNISKASWNVGRWRLMESPLMFLIRNRAIVDPNNEPFHWDCAYDCGDTESLYAGEPEARDDLPEAREKSIYEAAREEVEYRRKAREDGKKEGKFMLPRRSRGDAKEEEGKFKASDLVPIQDSPYLNSKYRTVPNRLDEDRLRQALYPQVGERVVKDPLLDHLRGKASDPKTKWMYGLAVALFMHGFSDKTKKDAKTIFDAMNHSFDSKGIAPERINMAHAMKLKLAPGKDRFYMENVMLHKIFLNVYFMALLKYARRRGVVSTASFGWVKCFDRTLWYVLNQTGRQVCPAEAAGAWSHYWAEEAMKRPLEDPYMEIAVEGFRTEMIIEGYLNEQAEIALKKEREEKALLDRFADSDRKENYGGR